MIIYTPLDLEQVMSGLDAKREFAELEYQGVLLQVELINSRQLKIERILSGGNEAFLDSRFQPGTIIDRMKK